MSHDGLIPSMFNRVQGTTKTPWVATVSCGESYVGFGHLPSRSLDFRWDERYFVGFDLAGNHQWNRFSQRFAYLLHRQHLCYRREFDAVLNCASPSVCRGLDALHTQACRRARTFSSSIRSMVASSSGCSPLRASHDQSPSWNVDSTPRVDGTRSSLLLLLRFLVFQAKNRQQRSLLR
jgi:hypothetical protein